MIYGPSSEEGVFRCSSNFQHLVTFRLPSRMPCRALLCVSPTWESCCTVPAPQTEAVPGGDVGKCGDNSPHSLSATPPQHLLCSGDSAFILVDDLDQSSSGHSENYLFEKHVCDHFSEEPLTFCFHCQDCAVPLPSLQLVLWLFPFFQCKDCWWHQP